ncbi:MAG: NTPase [Anaerolineae bacterium]|nr:NTPase [Anaerolineae bacterium]MDW8098781.1 NTPase [Anaerolineae bacterium]
MPANLLLTGAPGCGKTTIIEKVVSALPWGMAGGFFTRELRQGRGRIGFEVCTLTGERAVLAHVDIVSRHRVGRYGIDVATFERVGVAALERAIAAGLWVIVDEIGKMELFSERFRRALIAALDGPIPVLATISARPHPWCDQIKARLDVELWTVTPQNRDALPRRALEWLSARRV